MSYSTREMIQDKYNSAQTTVRYAVRRKYLREALDKFNFERQELTSEQKRAIDEYWKPYSKHICYKWHEFFYSVTGVFDVRYIPEDLMFTEIEGYLNKWDLAHALDNKNYYQMYFPEVRHPKTVCRRMSKVWHLEDYSLCAESEALAACLERKKLIIKVALDSGKGSGISIWNHSVDKKDDLLDIFRKSDCDILVQEFFEDQHPKLAEFNPESVNSIRIVTFVTKEGSIELLAAYLRMGLNGKSIDNVCAGGACSEITTSGRLYDYAYDKNARKIFVSSTGKKFEGFIVPGWDNVVAMAKQLHQKMGNFRLISWDFAVDKDENPVFIEMNLKYGAMEYHQLFKGPLFGDKTEEILDEVYGKSAN